MGWYLFTQTPVCGKWRYLPNDYFSKEVELIIDNTHVNVPTTRRARRFKNKMKVRFRTVHVRSAC